MTPPPPQDDRDAESRQHPSSLPHDSQDLPAVTGRVDYFELFAQIPVERV